jgi:multidrug efflux pump subunit AcrA (membrane-fusion protein)
LVTLPTGQSLPATAHTVNLAFGGERGKPRPARLLAAAPQTDVSTQGETWFFAADAAGLRTGMRLEARIPLGRKAVHGVLLPQSAVVWRDGQPWVFVKTAAAGFSRRLVAAHSEQGEAWFVAEGFAAGEEVVVVGAQMLLSEEQRRSGPHDGDDD